MVRKVRQYVSARRVVVKESSMYRLRRSRVSKCYRGIRGTPHQPDSKQTMKHLKNASMNFLVPPESLQSLTPDTMHFALISQLLLKDSKTTKTGITSYTPISCNVSQLQDGSVLVTPTSRICPVVLHSLSGGQWSLVLKEGKSSKLIMGNSSFESQDS